MSYDHAESQAVTHDTNASPATVRSCMMVRRPCAEGLQHCTVGLATSTPTYPQLRRLFQELDVGW